MMKRVFEKKTNAHRLRAVAALLVIMTAFTALAAGCGTAAPTSGVTVRYSNLADGSVCADLDGVMERAGVSDQRREVFFTHVDRFNSAVKPRMLAGAFETRDIMDPRYDAYDMQDEWSKKYPDFLGYNCRITSFSLFAEHVSVPETSVFDDQMILLDLDALESDGSALVDAGDRERFRVLFSTVDTPAVKDISAHAARLSDDWRQRGIVFDDSEDIRLISVVFHEAWEDESYLYIGHTGVLFPTEDGLLFVEKLAFQEPYQLSVFRDRSELKRYLMTKYDTSDQDADSADQPYAAPFVMENDALMEG